MGIQANKPVMAVLHANPRITQHIAVIAHFEYTVAIFLTTAIIYHSAYDHAHFPFSLIWKQ